MGLEIVLGIDVDRASAPESCWFINTGVGSDLDRSRRLYLSVGWVGGFSAFRFFP